MVNEGAMAPTEDATELGGDQTSESYDDWIARALRSEDDAPVGLLSPSFSLSDCSNSPQRNADDDQDNLIGQDLENEDLTASVSNLTVTVAPDVPDQSPDPTESTDDVPEHILFAEGTELEQEHAFNTEHAFSPPRSIEEEEDSSVVPLHSRDWIPESMRPSVPTASVSEDAADPETAAEQEPTDDSVPETGDLIPLSRIKQEPDDHFEWGENGEDSFDQSPDDEHDEESRTESSNQDSEDQDEDELSDADDNEEEPPEAVEPSEPAVAAIEPWPSNTVAEPQLSAEEFEQLPIAEVVESNPATAAIESAPFVQPIASIPILPYPLDITHLVTGVVRDGDLVFTWNPVVPVMTPAPVAAVMPAVTAPTGDEVQVDAPTTSTAPSPRVRRTRQRQSGPSRTPAGSSRGRGRPPILDENGMVLTPAQSSVRAKKTFAINVKLVAKNLRAMETKFRIYSQFVQNYRGTLEELYAMQEVLVGGFDADTLWLALAKAKLDVGKLSQTDYDYIIVNNQHRRSKAAITSAERDERKKYTNDMQVKRKRFKEKAKNQVSRNKFEYLDGILGMDGCAAIKLEEELMRLDNFNNAQLFEGVDDLADDAPPAKRLRLFCDE